MDKPVEIHDGIYTFADCGFRKEEIESNNAYDRAGIIGITTDPGLLDWSGCDYPNMKISCCQCNLEMGICPKKFPY
jgi:hypothetical protein